MSVEALVLLALFIMLPLVQELLRARRQRSQPDVEPAGEVTPARTPSPGPVPPLPDGAPHTADAVPHELTSIAEARASRPARLVTPALRTSPTLRHSAVAGMRNRRDVRRAIVLMALLGPCRARDPYNSPPDDVRS